MVLLIEMNKILMRIGKINLVSWLFGEPPEPKMENYSPAVQKVMIDYENQSKIVEDLKDKSAHLLFSPRNSSIDALFKIISQEDKKKKNIHERLLWLMKTEKGC